jgi:hypothetical protein
MEEGAIWASDMRALGLVSGPAPAATAEGEPGFVVAAREDQVRMRGETEGAGDGVIIFWFEGGVEGKNAGDWGDGVLLGMTSGREGIGMGVIFDVRGRLSS